MPPSLPRCYLGLGPWRGVWSQPDLEREWEIGAKMERLQASVLDMDSNPASAADRPAIQGVARPEPQSHLPSGNGNKDVLTL